jgi:ATP synthase F1 complex assembly factor 1
LETSIFSPYFILPLPLKTQYQTTFLEYKNNAIHVTSLEEYKAKGPAAEAYIDIFFYTELAESKNLVLLKGIIHSDQIASHIAQALVNQLQIFYNSDEVRVFFFVSS